MQGTEPTLPRSIIYIPSIDHFITQINHIILFHFQRRPLPTSQSPDLSICHTKSSQTIPTSSSSSFSCYHPPISFSCSYTWSTVRLFTAAQSSVLHTSTPRLIVLHLPRASVLPSYLINSCDFFRTQF